LSRAKLDRRMSNKNEEEYKEELKRRERFSRREVEPIFNRCYPPGYRKLCKVRRNRVNPQKKFYRARRWKQLERHKQIYIINYSRRFRNRLRYRRKAHQN
jgi:hypothetical protein